MAPSTTPRSATRSLRFAAPVVAVAAFGLVACGAPETPSDVPGTTPPVWTGSEDPNASAVEADAPVGSRASESAITADLESADGNTVGTVSIV